MHMLSARPILFTFNSMLMTVILVAGPVLAQVQHRFPGAEKTLLESEFNRYRSLIFAGQSVTAEEGIDVRYYNIAIEITPFPPRVDGIVTMTAVSLEDGLDSIRLDLVSSLVISSVTVNGSPAGFHQHVADFDVALDRPYASGESFDVVIEYGGTPGERLQFTTTGGGAPFICSLSEPYFSRDWWPCKDHPSDKADSVDLQITVPVGLKAGSNGTLLTTVSGPTTTTYYWHHGYPIATYLVSVSVSNYSEFTDWFKYSPTDSMPVLNYFLPEHVDALRDSMRETVDMLGVFSDLFGLYPFVEEKYGHSEYNFGPWGAMEHQTMTSIIMPSYSRWLVAHELAHQWFGDMITHRTWPHIWLTEGLAEYAFALYEEKRVGQDAYRAEIGDRMTDALTAAGSLHRADSSALFDMPLIYYKGSTIPHMLRHVMGDSLFFAGLKTYAGDPDYRYGNAVTEDFRGVLEDISGTDLGYFFDEWIYGSGYPHYTHHWNASAGPDGYLVDLYVSQETGTANPAYFTMPLDVRLSAPGWDTTVVVFNDSAWQHKKLQVSHLPTTIELDPHDWILKSGGDSITASGPVIVDSVAASRIDDDSVRIDLWLRNGGEMSEVSAIRVKLRTSDPLVLAFPVDEGEFGSLAPGTRSAAPVSFVITVDSATRCADIPIAVEISDSNHTGVCWKGDIVIAIGPRLVTASAVVDVGTVFVGYPTTREIVVRNPNPVPSEITEAVCDPPSIFTISPASALLGPFDSVVFAISYAPLVIGLDTGRVLLSTDLPCDSMILSVTGVCAPIGVAVLDGWNMMSVPVQVGDYSKDAVFPGAGPFGYHYLRGYHLQPVLVPGEGYWLKYESAGVREIPGLPVMAETVGVEMGWNMIGSITHPLAVSSIASIPGGILTTGFFCYVGDGEYEAEDTIKPGCAAWVKVSQEGQLILSEGEPLMVSNRIRIEVTGELPPPPPGETDRVPDRTVPSEYRLSPNYPNPFNPLTVIEYALPEAGHVRLTVFNVLGQEVRELVNEIQEPGYRSVSFDAGGLPSGVYTYRLTAGKFTGTNRMLLLK